MHTKLRSSTAGAARGVIQYLTSVHFGSGVLAILPELLRQNRIRRALLVTDRGAIAAGLLDRVLEIRLRGFRWWVFDGTPQNPTEEAAVAAARLIRSQGCDGIVAVGGGSPLDLAKAAALLATHRGPLSRYAAVLGGSSRIRPNPLPLIAIPTTAGSGSEVGRAALIVTRERRKIAIISSHLLPRAAICDPELTSTMPRALTAGTGMDALSHGVETFLSPAFNPPADALALDCLARANRAIERACADGDDRSARCEMMMAALEGGLAFQKGLGAVHALSHALGALKAPFVHHGTANAVLLPAVLRFNVPVLGEKLPRLRRALGLGNRAEVGAHIEGLNRRLGLPATLRELGVRRSQLQAIAGAAAADFSARTNPRPAAARDYLALLDEAYG